VRKHLRAEPPVRDRHLDQRFHYRADRPRSWAFRTCSRPSSRCATGDSPASPPERLLLDRKGHAARGMAGRARPDLASFEASWFYSDWHNDLPLLERVSIGRGRPDDVLRSEAVRRGLRVSAWNESRARRRLATGPAAWWSPSRSARRPRAARLGDALLLPGRRRSRASRVGRARAPALAGFRLRRLLALAGALLRCSCGTARRPRDSRVSGGAARARSARCCLAPAAAAVNLAALAGATLAAGAVFAFR